MNPTSIWFRRKLPNGVSGEIVLAGCIHGLDHRCRGCHHDSEDIKDNDVFARMRSWKVCQLWNRDPYVVGMDAGLDV